jgi:hypothetical protein
MKISKIIKDNKKTIIIAVLINLLFGFTSSVVFHFSDTSNNIEISKSSKTIKAADKKEIEKPEENEETFEQVHKKIMDEIKFINSRRVLYDKNLSKKDLATEEEIYNRAYWTVKYAKELNSLYKDMDYLFVAKMMTAIIGRETSWVNYANLDSGLSTGVVSMRYSTARLIANKLNEPFNKQYFSQDVKKQIKYGIYYLYEQIDRFDGDYHSAIIAYNKGPNGVKANEPRFENYFFNVLGRLEYFRKNTA